MTEAERLLWERVQRRAASLTPQLSAALFKAFATLRGTLSDEEVRRLTASGDVDRLVDRLLSRATFDVAMQPAREKIRAGLAENVRYFTRDLPVAPRARVVTGFDILNTRVIEAGRRLETKVFTNMEANIRETVRAYAENGLRSGTPVREVARGLRDVVGLAPNQADAVARFRQMLEDRDPAVLTRLTRDARYDRLIEQAFGKDGKGLTAAQIDVISNAQRARMLAFNTQTIARTAALDTVKLSNRLTWEDAAERGTIERDRVRRTWAGVMDSRERPEHVKMEGETVRLDENYSNGQKVPGDSDYGCRCIEHFTMARV
jgi:hypothetical protein